MNHPDTLAIAIPHLPHINWTLHLVFILAFLITMGWLLFKVKAEWWQLLPPLIFGMLSSGAFTQVSQASSKILDSAPIGGTQGVTPGLVAVCLGLIVLTIIKSR